LSILRLNKSNITRYFDPQFRAYLPSWQSLVTRVKNTSKRGCSRCRRNGKAWREFLAWYPQNTKAFLELKTMLKCSYIEFWDTLNKPVKKVTV